MTTILQQQCYRNTAGNATVYVEKYMDKFAFPLWRVAYHRDGSPITHIVLLKELLVRKPSRRQIQTYLDRI